MGNFAKLVTAVSEGPSNPASAAFGGVVVKRICHGTEEAPWDRTVTSRPSGTNVPLLVEDWQSTPQLWAKG